MLDAAGGNIVVVSLPVGVEFLVERYKFFEERITLGVRAGSVHKTYLLAGAFYVS